jgi:hypothetical protein
VTLASPVRRGSPRQGSNLAAYVIGLLAGGVLAALGAWIVSGLFQPLPFTIRATALAAIAILALCHDLGLLRVRLPQNRRQVPQEIFHRGLGRAAFQFGFEMGTGVRTFVPATAPYVLAAALVLLGGGPLLVPLVGVGFALGRAAMILCYFWSREGSQWTQRATSRLGWVVPCSAIAAVAVVAKLLAPL